MAKKGRHPAPSRVVLPPVPCFLSPPFGEDCPHAEFQPAPAQGRARQHNCSRTWSIRSAARLPTISSSSGPKRASRSSRTAAASRSRASSANCRRPALPSTARMSSSPTAVKEAARLIGKAKLPLFGGLATDVGGMRAVMALAERAGGIVDHALSEAQYRNFKILQTTGWMTTTLTETRNRADLIIIAGSDIHRLHPRFFERIVSPPDSMFDVTAPKRTVVFIGKGLDRSGAKGSRIGEVVTLACKDEEAGHAVALLQGAAARLPGHAAQAWRRHACRDRCARRALPQAAQYGVVVWAPPSLDFPHAELAVEQFTGLVEGPQSHHALRRACARRRRGRDHGGSRMHMDQRLSAPRELRQRRARLRPLPLGHRPHARKTARAIFSSGSPRSRRASCRLRPSSRPSCSARRVSRSPRRPRSSSPSARRGSIMPGVSFVSTTSCPCR